MPTRRRRLSAGQGAHCRAAQVDHTVAPATAWLSFTLPTTELIQFGLIPQVFGRPATPPDLGLLVRPQGLEP